MPGPLSNSDFKKIDLNSYSKFLDPQDPRLIGHVQNISLSGLQGHLSFDAPPIAILGYPDDEGIQLNGGRPGAKDAPDRIRKFLYRMTPHLESPDKKLLLDLGNLQISHFQLAERHLLGSQVIELLNQQQILWISFGGGHDYGYADGSGFLRSHLKMGIRPLIINFDAHLDVRPLNNGLHSGTPFYRLLTEFSGTFDFIEIGIQPQCNSHHHFSWCLENGGHVIKYDLDEDKAYSKLVDRLATHNNSTQPCFLSLDMDVFSSAFAPGCSQSWATGISVGFFWKCLELLKLQRRVQGLGIYEVSPPLDFDDQTSKLAALVAHQFIAI